MKRPGIVNGEHLERSLGARSHGLPMLASVEALEAVRERLAKLERRLAALEGGRDGRSTRGRLSGLTETERRIVGLVVAGRTNDEVAQQLFLSPKTVEWNLTKAYRKLQVRSRTELAAQHAAGGDS